VEHQRFTEFAENNTAIKGIMNKIAWATKSQSNGKITSWSRWHIVYNTVGGTVTLCGIGVPHTKWILGGNDSRVKGGNCGACLCADNRRYPKPNFNFKPVK
jgi:hypothetical protein